jgi:hypothetical protein
LLKLKTSAPSLTFSWFQAIQCCIKSFQYQTKDLLKLDELDKYLKSDFMTESELVAVAESGDILLFEYSFLY